MGYFRDRMERDMEIRGYAPGTRRVYLGTIQDFVRFLGRTPESATPEDVHRYQQHLVRERRLCWNTFNTMTAVLRFFFKVTLRKKWDDDVFPRHRAGRKLPEVLSTTEMSAFLGTPSNLKHRAILMTAYGTGLRASEITHLKVSDIDSSRMVVRVRQGKRRKDRYVMLSPRLLEILREYWRTYRPRTWLFPGQDPRKPLSTRSVHTICQIARRTGAIHKKVCTRTLRHAFATHLLEGGTNIRVIQLLLGHRSLRSTEIYTHVARTYTSETSSPLDALTDGRTNLIGKP
jgi:site-specific recombinase XerD